MTVTICQTIFPSSWRYRFQFKQTRLTMKKQLKNQFCDGIRYPLLIKMRTHVAFQILSTKWRRFVGLCLLMSLHKRVMSILSTTRVWWHHMLYPKSWLRPSSSKAWLAKRLVEFGFDLLEEPIQRNSWSMEVGRKTSFRPYPCGMYSSKGFIQASNQNSPARM